MTTCSLINESYLNQMLNVDMTLLGLYMSLVLLETAAVAQWVRAFAPQSEGWMFESQP